MKAKNLYIAAALCAGTFAVSNVANAQDVFVDDAVSVTEFTCDNASHYFSNSRSNWFIEIGGGAGQTLVETKYDNPVTGHLWTAAYSFGFGRWFSPYMGFRIKAIGGALHAETPNWDYPKADSWTSSKHVNLQAELMWDMFNSFGGVNENRVFSIIPFFGLGGDANWDFQDASGNIPAATNCFTKGRAKSVQWTLPVSAGLQFRFRLCKYVDFFAEARATFYGDNWNNVVEGESVDAHVAAMGGFNFNIGGRGWNTFNECNYVSQIASLNGQVNDLRAQLGACAATVASLQAQLPCPEVVQKECNNAPLMATVRFTINSDKIMPTEEVNVYSMAEWLKANPKESIVIAGYADRDTGTTEYNMELSQRRADAVKAALVDTYGIDPSRLTTKAFGSDVQEYSTNDWNRIVIFKQ
ncbi:MAG: OmpA family protein [Muribaculaceae bacterium]|nr:OmpA family protein [Muribaculaceae bacterium]